MKLESKKKELAKKMQKGKASLEIPKSKTGRNEDNKMMEGKNETNRW